MVALVAGCVDGISVFVLWRFTPIYRSIGALLSDARRFRPFQMFRPTCARHVPKVQQR